MESGSGLYSNLRVGGILVRLIDRMGLIYLNLSGRVEGNSLNIVDLRWRMVLILDFGMPCGVGNKPLR